MRDGDWKVLAKLSVGKHTNVDTRNEVQIKNAKLSDFQIFNVTNDISERKDLADSNPDKLAELEQRLKTHYHDLVKGSHIWGKTK